MTTFQIITLILSGLGLLGAIVAVYIKTQIDITKLQRDISYIYKDSDRKEIALLLIEKNNREDHNEILQKLNEIKNGK